MCPPGRPSILLTCSIVVALVFGTACSEGPTGNEDAVDFVGSPQQLQIHQPRLKLQPQPPPTAQAMGLEESDVVYLEFDRPYLTDADRTNWRAQGAHELHFFHSAPAVLLRAPKASYDALRRLPRVIDFSEGALGSFAQDASSWTILNPSQGHGFGSISPSFQLSQGVTVGIVDSGILVPYADIPVGAFGTGWSADPNWDPYGDDLGHGTSVASTVMARVNGTLVRGAAPQGNIFVAAYRITGTSPSPNCLHVAAGVDEAAAVTRAVINISIGYDPADASECHALKNAITFATSPGVGAVVTVAAGNLGTACGGGTHLCFPANIPESFTVTGVRQFGPLVVFDSEISRYGSEADISAGDREIAVSCGTSAHRPLCPTPWGYAPGTSYAAPTVAAAAALVMGRYPDSYRKGSVIRLHLQDYVFGPSGPQYGAGILNALGPFNNDPCQVYDCSDDVINPF